MDTSYSLHGGHTTFIEVVDRRLFHRCGASVDLELSCLETLLSLEVKGSTEGILYDGIYIMITEK